MRRWILGGAATLALSLGAALRLRVSLATAPPETCAGCHSERAAEWGSSRHAVAFTNTAFQVSWSRTESPWCEACHADSSRPHGIGCASCHSGGDSLVADAPSLLARLAHPIRHSEALTDERACERCHQFSLPSPGALTSGVDPMPFAETPSQDTVGEWRRSSAQQRGSTCVSCHDPHAAEGAHDREFMREAISVEAHYDGVNVTATVRAEGVGHAVPTGDPFRRIELAICGPAPCEVPLASVFLERTRRAEGTDWVVVSDTRIPAPVGDQRASERTFVLTPGVPLPPGARFRLVYRYPEPVLEQSLSRDDRYFVIDQGTLVPGDPDVL